MKKCALCDLDKKLVESHLFPRFIIKWVKSTSVTPYLRHGDNPLLRKQDGYKKPLLCQDCENIFSNYETYFSKKVFHPYMTSKSKFTHSLKLKKFVISLSWRVLAWFIEEFKKEENICDSLFLEAFTHWKKILTNQDLDDELYSHYLFFNFPFKKKDYLPHYREEYFFLRNVGAGFSDEKPPFLIVVKLPHMVCVSSVHPKKLPALSDSCLQSEGDFSSFQKDSIPFSILEVLGHIGLGAMNFEANPKDEQMLKKSLEQVDKKDLPDHIYRILKENKLI